MISIIAKVQLCLYLFAGICQRQHTAYFPGIPTEQEKISSDVAALYIEKIQGKFPLSNCEYSVGCLTGNVNLCLFCDR